MISFKWLARPSRGGSHFLHSFWNSYHHSEYSRAHQIVIYNHFIMLTIEGLKQF